MKKYFWVPAIALSLLLLIFLMFPQKAFNFIKVEKTPETPIQLKPVKVFQIGFNKCGTTTLSDFFNENGVKSLHYDKGKLALDIWRNYLAKKPLISPAYDEYYGFFDMENIVTNPPIYIAQNLFKELDRQYPGSKFILNRRDKKKWLKSRTKHIMESNGKTTISYLDVISKQYNKSKQAVLEQWSEEWDRHFASVLEYFKDRPNDLLIYNVETDSPEKLRDFFKENFVLNVELYKHKNKTKK